MGPTHPADVLVTRLRDGTQVTVGEEAVLPFLEDAISEVEGAGADFTLVVCTGAFPSLRHANPLLFAGPLLTAGVTALTTGLAVDIFCPDGQQIDAVRDKWQAAHVTVGTLHVASPYRDAERALRDAARAVGDPNFIVLDCMGYTEAMAETVQAGTGIPTIPARRVVARLAGLLA